mgnify:CR=1 FL=1
MSNFKIGDALIRIKNASIVGKSSTTVPKSKYVLGMLKVLKNYGFIKDFSESAESKYEYSVELAYDAKGRAKVTNVKLFSKPGRHLYMKAKELKPSRSGTALSLISTTAGVMAYASAKKQNLGGEIICEIW